MSDDFDALVSKLRALRDAWDIDIARTAFDKSAPAFSPADRDRLEALVFGDLVAGDKHSVDTISGGNVAIGAGATATQDQRGAVMVSGGNVRGPAIGLNLGTIIYDDELSEMQREQLVRYLQRLADKLQRLPLRGLAARLDDGQGVPLAKVYISLATTGMRQLTNGSPEEVADYCTVEHSEVSLASGTHTPAWHITVKEQYMPDVALPYEAIVNVRVEDDGRNIVLARQYLASEAVFDAPQLVLLGEPGGGKSTFVRHLAWALALRGRDQLSPATQLFGWPDDTRLLPVLLPLRTLAGRLATESSEPATVSATLRDEMTRTYDARQADLLLDKALANQAALLLLDGLDEVPLVAIPRQAADRQTTLRAVRDFAELHRGTRIIVTCRTRAFDPSLQAQLGWPQATIAPLTLGQVRAFTADWFEAMVDCGAIQGDLAIRQADQLVQTIAANERLRDMASTPLLLTMMAIVLTEKGELPRDRALLYERILEQLLGQWDQQKGGQSLSEVIGDTKLQSDDLHATLDQLSYTAHANAASADGRGRIANDALHLALSKFFERVGVDGAWEAPKRCIAYFHDRSGLLMPEERGDAYAFAHLTLQEHGAGRHMLLHDEAVKLVMQHRTDDRWREPIALGLGVLHRLHPTAAERVFTIFSELVYTRERGQPKSLERWYRDLILAAELGSERDWNLLRARINVERIHDELRPGLVTLLADKAQPLPVVERVRAGFLLGELGDPRYPVTVAQWQEALEQALRGDSSGKSAAPSLASTLLAAATTIPTRATPSDRSTASASKLHC